MRDLVRAVTQFACEVTIYVAERIIEALATERPMMDDPLPENHVPDEHWSPAHYPNTIQEWRENRTIAVPQQNPENN